MIAKVYIKHQLNKLNTLYSRAVSGSDPFLPKLYSKLAVLELCGWTEECMDEIMSHYIKRKRLNDIDNIKFIKKKIIGKNYGFSYDKHFRGMLTNIIGIVQLEKIEQKMNQVKRNALESSLSRLKPERDSHAHETIRTTKTFTAPSACLGLFNDIVSGLTEYEKWLKKI